MVVHTCNSCTQKAKARKHKLDGTLGYLKITTKICPHIIELVILKLSYTEESLREFVRISKSMLYCTITQVQLSGSGRLPPYPSVQSNLKSTAQGHLKVELGFSPIRNLDF